MKNALLAGHEWAQDKAIEFERAHKCITDFRGVYSEAIANELATVLSDLGKIHRKLDFPLLRTGAHCTALGSRIRFTAVHSKYNTQIGAHWDLATE